MCKIELGLIAWLTSDTFALGGSGGSFLDGSHKRLSLSIQRKDGRQLELVVEPSGQLADRRKLPRPRVVGVRTAV